MRSTRRHACTVCRCLVDVTGLVRIDTIRDASRAYTCRVATACAVRAARRERTRPVDAVLVVSDSIAQTCRFCGCELVRPYALASEAPGRPASGTLYECRSVGACERRMLRGVKP